jgi:hypothetical protein
MSKDPAASPSGDDEQPNLLSVCDVCCAVIGGAERDRTADLKLAKLPLSQLSYGPNLERMVGPGRLELPTSRLSGVRSNHLSYGPSGSRQKTGSSPGRTLRTMKFATLTREIRRM